VPKQRRFAVVFAPEVLEHLQVIERLIHRSIEEQLAVSPGEATRNRKPLEQPAPFDATWELRCGPGNRFRVFYEIEPKARLISVLAVGIKDRNKLLTSGEEFET